MTLYRAEGDNVECFTSPLTCNASPTCLLHGERVLGLSPCRRRGSRPCREWDGARNKRGYGVRREGVRLQYVHRQEWEAHHGPIPSGLEVMHECDNPPCYEITHLRLGTHAENMADMARKGRARNGTGN